MNNCVLFLVVLCEGKGSGRNNVLKPAGFGVLGKGRLTPPTSQVRGSSFSLKETPQKDALTNDGQIMEGTVFSFLVYLSGISL